MSAVPRTITVEITSDEFVITCRMLAEIRPTDPKFDDAQSAFTKLFKAARELRDAEERAA